MSHDIKSLIKLRGCIKTKLTLYKRFISGLDPSNLTTERVIDIELRTSKINSVFDEFEKCQSQIETLIENPEEQLTERESFENAYYESVSLARSFIDECRGLPRQEPFNTTCQIDTIDAIKYPEISLPNFSGKPTEWIEFRDTFDALINKGNLKPIQKYKYLKSCLKDSALEVVGALDYSEESYSLAWQLLCERFNKPKLLLKNHMRELFHTDITLNNPRSLRQLVDNISKNIRNLRNLGAPTDEWDLVVIFLMSSKLDNHLMKKWEEVTSSKDMPTLQDFKAFLRNQADLMEATTTEHTAWINPSYNRSTYTGKTGNFKATGIHNLKKEDEPRGRKRSAQAAELDEEDDDKHDEVRLWEDGFKERYYESKFEVSKDNLEFRYRVALQYVRGLCWVLRYYYQGCASWKWYFPYHYAPFASDFVNICGLSTKFEKGTQPFRPLEQLMGVFPAASSQHVPQPWAVLMSDPFSPIIDFYPTDFKIDLNGKKFAWQGVALLPFVDEGRLFKALEPYYKELTQAEIQRNIRGHDRLYVSTGNKSYEYLLGLYQAAGPQLRALADKRQRHPYSCDGVRGDVMLSVDSVCIGGQLASPVIGLKPVLGNRAVCVRFQDPEYPEDFIFPARRLKLAIEPPRVLKPGNLGEEQNRNWRPQIGMVRSHTIASLESAGRRMLGHHLPPETRAYSSVPPPQNQQGHHNRSQSFGPHRSGYVPRQGYNQNQGHNQNQGYRSQNNQDRYNSNQNRQGYSTQNQGGYQSQGSYQSQGYSQNRQGHNQGHNSNRYNPYQNSQNRRHQGNSGNQGGWR